VKLLSKWNLNWNINKWYYAYQKVWSSKQIFQNHFFKRVKFNSLMVKNIISIYFYLLNTTTFWIVYLTFCEEACFFQTLMTQRNINIAHTSFEISYLIYVSHIFMGIFGVFVSLSHPISQFFIQYDYPLSWFFTKRNYYWSYKFCLLSQVNFCISYQSFRSM
jgi:hypothetical protein